MAEFLEAATGGTIQVVLDPVAVQEQRMWVMPPARITEACRASR